MKIRILYILLALMMVSPQVDAQKSKTTKKTTTQKTTSKKKTSTKKSGATSIEGLKNERAQIQKKIKQQEKALQANRADVKKRLQNLMTLNSQITDQKKKLDVINNDISHLDGDISLIQSQLETLQKQLEERKDKYVKSLRYMTRNNTFQDKLMFIFSSHDFTQMYRRMRFIKEYASYQRAQGEVLKVKQAQVEEKQRQLEEARQEKSRLLSKGESEKKALETQQNEQQKMVNNLQKQQKTIQSVIDEQKRKDAALNAKIDKLIAEEVARQQAEARRKAEAEAEAKRRAAEVARKKAEAEAAARENAERIKAARAEEKRLKEEAARATAAEKQRAEQKAREAEAARIAAERKAEADKERNEKAVAKANEASNVALYNSVDQKLSSNFESNKGRLPIPVTGQYRIVSHFGQYNVEGLKNVTLDNKGVNILGSPGCQARSIFDGEVTGVANIGGTWLVLVRHGRYISVYCNLRSVSVSKGQKVSARQALGTVGSDNILQFQLRKETAKLNPEVWLGR